MDFERKRRRREELRENGYDNDAIDSILSLEEELEKTSKDYRELDENFKRLEKNYEKLNQWIYALKMPPNDLYYVVRNQPEKNRALLSNGRAMTIYSYGTVIKDELKYKLKPGTVVAIGDVPTPVIDPATKKLVVNPETGKVEIIKVKAITEILDTMEAPLNRVKLLKVEDGNLYGLKDDDIGVFELSPNHVVTQKIPKSKSSEFAKMKNLDVDLFTETMEIIRVSKDTLKVDVEKNIKKVTYADVGGLEKEIEQVREMIELPAKYPDIYKRIGIEPPKGVLFYGPAGTGKTLLAKAIATECDFNFYQIAGPEIMSKWYGQSEENLRKVFEKAKENDKPSIIFIDELDSIAAKRDDIEDVSRRVVSQLLTLMDGLESRGKIIVIAATNRPDDVDPALRRPGRFDREIEFPIPNDKARYEILNVHTRNSAIGNDVDLNELASILHGYSGADIASLVKEAGMRVIRKYKDELTSGKARSLESYRITKEDFMEAYNKIVPTSMRDIHVEIPNVRWEDVGGLEYAKQELREAIEQPLKYKNLYKHANMKPPRGVLLYGESGTGKTLLAKAVATESGVNFIPIRGPEIFSKWLGDSEKAIRDAFKKARQSAPCIIFFDEIDAIAVERGRISGDSGVGDKVVSQLLTEMDGIEKIEGVYVIAATNRPDLIDQSLLRPGRFDKKIEFKRPDVDTRYEIFKIHVRKKPIEKDVEESLHGYAEKTEGYTGADIENIVNSAEQLAMRDFISKYGKEADEKYSEFKITKEYFDRALEERSVNRGYGQSGNLSVPLLKDDPRERKPSYVG